MCVFHGNLLISHYPGSCCRVILECMKLVPMNKLKPADMLQKQWTGPPHDLLLPVKFQTTGQPKTRASCLTSLEQMQQCVPPQNGRSVGPSSTFLFAFIFQTEVLFLWRPTRIELKSCFGFMLWANSWAPWAFSQVVRNARMSPLLLVITTG